MLIMRKLRARVHAHLERESVPTKHERFVNVELYLLSFIDNGIAFAAPARSSLSRVACEHHVKPAVLRTLDLTNNQPHSSALSTT
jgi:hypothetical protein